MVNDLKKSDSAIVAVKQANKGRQRPAESVESRAEAKRNSGNRSTHRAQERESVSQAATRIRQAVKRNPEERLVALLHHITVPVLAEAFHSLKSDVAAGVDGVTWEMYADGLGDRLTDLCDRIHRGAYRAPPVRRVEIPKADGGKRPLGIATLEDKIVQKAVTDTILVPIYESEFLGFSYGFRQGRGAHNALDALTVGIQRRKISWIVDADIRGFFDNVDRGWLIRFLKHRIGDKRVIRLITKWLNAGVMDGDTWVDTGMGTPQGAIISPILANVYLHYVFDLWVHKTWRGRQARGDMIVVRYADDFVVGFQHKWEADRFLSALKERLAQFELALHPDKTRLIEFGRFAKASRKRRGQRKPETFDFLGMTHFCDQSRKGRFRVGRKPSRKRVRRTLRRIKDELRKRTHMGAHTVAKWLGRVINGWLNYYAVPGTARTLQAFVDRIRRMLLRTMRRRSQKDRFEWSKIDLLQNIHWPKPTIRHPWPDQRFAVKTQGRSPVR
jgi:group II intron reverse transcriptase/maturase